MKKNRLHISSLFLCGLLMLPLILMVALQVYQVVLKHTAFERMEERNIVSLTVPEEKVVWREEGREVTIDGEFFDLVSWELADGIYSFKGAYDQEETAAHNLLAKQTGTGLSITGLLIFGQCFAAALFYFIQFACPRILHRRGAYLQKIYKSIFSPIPAPPPWQPVYTL